MLSAVLVPIGDTLAAFVARNRCKRLRLDTDGLPENFFELLPRLVQAHSPPRLDQRRLNRGVGEKPPPRLEEGGEPGTTAGLASGVRVRLGYRREGGLLRTTQGR